MTAALPTTPVGPQSARRFAGSVCGARRQRPPASLTRRVDFLRAQTRGVSLRGRLLCLAIWSTAGEAAGTPLRVGYTVSRRVGNAVVRNRVRRRLREIVRRGVGLPTAACDLVWIAYAGAAAASAQQLAVEAHGLLRRAAKLAPCPPPASSRS